MASSEDVLAESPIDFGTAVAYALQPDMRRLIIIYLVGGLLFSFGSAGFLEVRLFHSLPSLLGGIAALLAAILGAVLLFGGLIGALFKIVADANRLAAAD